MSKDIRQQVENCDTCAEFSNIRKTNKPTLASFDKSVAALQPMQHIRADLFKPKAGIVFLVLVDLASNFLFVDKITSKTCKNIMSGLDKIFCIFAAIPSLVRTIC